MLAALLILQGLTCNELAAATEAFGEIAEKEVWARRRTAEALNRSIPVRLQITRPPPLSADEHVSLGNKLYRAADDVAAEKHARAAVELDGNNAQALKLLGRVLVQLSRPEEGLTFLQQSLAIAPDDGESWHKLAGTYYELGYLRAAATAFYTAGALLDSPLSWLSAAHTLQRLKSPKAFPLYWTAVRLDPRFDDAWQDLSHSLSEQSRKVPPFPLPTVSPAVPPAVWREMLPPPPSSSLPSSIPNHKVLAEFAARKSVELKRSADSLFRWGNQVPPRTKWTRRVPHPVLIGHAASLTRPSLPGRGRGAGGVWAQADRSKSSRRVVS